MKNENGQTDTTDDRITLLANKVGDIYRMWQKCFHVWFRSFIVY